MCSLANFDVCNERSPCNQYSLAKLFTYSRVTGVFSKYISSQSISCHYMTNNLIEGCKNHQTNLNGITFTFMSVKSELQLSIRHSQSHLFTLFKMVFRNDELVIT